METPTPQVLLPGRPCLYQVTTQYIARDVLMARVDGLKEVDRLVRADELAEDQQERAKLLFVYATALEPHPLHMVPADSERQIKAIAQKAGVFQF